MEWIINQLRVHPELAIFLTLFAGFWLGRLKIGKFSLGTVTSVLLVGVLVGQLNITVDGPMKAVFFLLFLFAVGYKVGPQFFRGLKKDGLPQVGFAVLMCIVSLVAPWILAKIMGYHVGEAWKVKEQSFINPNESEATIRYLIFSNSVPCILMRTSI